MMISMIRWPYDVAMMISMISPKRSKIISLKSFSYRLWWSLWYDDPMMLPWWSLWYLPSAQKSYRLSNFYIAYDDLYDMMLAMTAEITLGGTRVSFFCLVFATRCIDDPLICLWVGRVWVVVLHPGPTACQFYCEQLVLDEEPALLFSLACAGTDLLHSNRL